MDGLLDTDMVVIGKTGNGKSATGNSILRRKAFTSRASTTSVTTEVSHEVSDFNGRVIKVVDGPGIGDTRVKNEEGVQRATQAMETVIAANPRGYHAFLIVIRFGTRFTTEEVEAIALLKKIFGDSFVKSYCILVLTGGDNFAEVSEETGQLFQEWCRVQEGPFKTLLEECDGRAVLFDNKTRDDSIKCAQLTKLLQMVDNLRFQDRRYTAENFASAKATRERAIVEAKVPMIHEDTARETSQILLKLQEILSQGDIEEKVKLKIRVGKLQQKIFSEDKGTGVLHDLEKCVKIVQRLVEEDINLFYLFQEDSEEVEQMKGESSRLSILDSLELKLEQMRKMCDDPEDKYREQKQKQGKIQLCCSIY